MPKNTQNNYIIDQVEVALGMPVQKAIGIWRLAGAPTIRLSQCATCSDLEKLLSHTNISPEHLEAVRT